MTELFLSSTQIYGLIFLPAASTSALSCVPEYRNGKANDSGWCNREEIGYYEGKR